MKKLYSLPWGTKSPHKILASLLLLLSIAGSAFGQAFTETFEGIEKGVSIDEAQQNSAFDNFDFIYSGNAIGADASVVTANTLSNASGGGSIFFGSYTGSNATPTNTTSPLSLTVGGIAGPISQASISFSLFANGTVGSTQSLTLFNNRFIVEVSVNGGASYTAYSCINTNGANNISLGAWNRLQIVGTLPTANSYSIRLRKSTVNTFYVLDDLVLSGLQTGITISTSNISFSNTYVNERSTPSRLTVSGAGLTSNIVLTAPDGFLLRKGTEEYSLSTTLTQTNGSVASTAIDVIFAPTVAKFYSGTLTVSSSGSETRNVTLDGTSEVRPPSTLVAPPSITFGGSTVVGQASAPSDFTVSGSNLTANVTVTPSANYQIRFGTTGNFTSSALTLVPTNGALAQTTLQVRFLPTTSGTITGSIRVASTGAGDKVVELSATAAAAPTGPTVNAAPTDLAFGTASGSGAANTLTFDVSGTNLTEALVVTPSNSNIVIREANTGSFVNTPLSFSPVNGTITNRTIEVRLVGPVASGNFSGTISVGSGNAIPRTVNVTASPVLAGNSTINTKGSLSEFDAVPGQPSESQSYIITGTNLLQDVQVEAPNFFQVSLTNDFSNLTSTGNTISIPRNSGNDLTETTIYVRYFPTAAQTNSSIILHNSDPAVQVSLSVTGSSEPSLTLEQAYNNNEQVTLNTNSAGQAIPLRGRRVNQPVTISLAQSTNSANSSNAPQFQLSLDNQNFSNTVVITPDQNSRSISRPIYVRYSPTYLGGQNGASARLQFQSNDFANSNTQAFPTNASVVGWSIDTRPAREAAVKVTRNGSTVTVNFELPANYASLGYGEGRLIIASENAALTQLPANGTPYTTGNQKYGAQTFTGSPGYFVVYSGANSEAVIESLDPTKTYYFYTFEYNNITTINGRLTSVQTAENYLTPTTPDAVPAYVAPGTPLPVELKSFAAKLTAGGVKLDWVTASEKNNKGFEVQRSQDGEQFSVLQFVKGQGSKGSKTVYSTLDEQPLSGTSYYRLKQVDEDGTFAYSPVAAISNTEAAREMSFYPNPVHDVLRISANESLVGARVIITDLTGRTLLTSKLDATNSVSLNTLRTGTYLVTVETKEGKVTRKVVKE